MRASTTQNLESYKSTSQIENIIHKIDQVLHSKLMSELVYEKLKRERSMLAISIMNRKQTKSEKKAFWSLRTA